MVPMDERRILLVEDNETNQRVAEGMLRRLAYRCDVVANGRAAIKALSEKPYDLVLMDVEMPEMDGFEATRAIRQFDENSLNYGIPIIALTAYAMQGDEGRCINAGMDDYLSKPIDPALLSHTLKRWLTVAKRRDTAPAISRRDTVERPGTVSSTPSVFDETAFLSGVVGDQHLAQGIVSDFLSDTEMQLRALTDRIASGDTESAVRLVHKIRGAAAALGAEALQNVLADMEKSGARGDLDRLAMEQAALNSRFEETKKALASSNFLG
jgi:CheY-like chemotaxis protein/HPt (histidine-containing phosphotransfer) domain-containing protein